MNMLTREIKRSLKELNLGLKGELTMTSDMENLQNAIFLDMVPDSWTKRAYPSMAGLAGWFVDLLSRIKELETWTGDFALPSAVWLAGFFNPQSFLTAIMQSMARKNEWPLDKMTLQCDVTKKNREDFSSPPREGAYVHGLFMEGARWDTQPVFEHVRERGARAQITRRQSTRSTEIQHKDNGSVDFSSVRDQGPDVSREDESRNETRWIKPSLHQMRSLENETLLAETPTSVMIRNEGVVETREGFLYRRTVPRKSQKVSSSGKGLLVVHQQFKD
ncbi:unnamed protein product [Ranitomeya imitator]|uniref:Dynein heavy chain C-terminal domain-containing protein n=1 Tax=Ranitomeya imitator TaxID=111125 RepID=A0ABN9L320_9NEOB|nr:unnamed protein product [Ranitomeya imitator]